MSPAFVPTIKKLLASVSTAQTERFAHQVLQLKTAEEIRTYLSARLHEISSDLEALDSTFRIVDGCLDRWTVDMLN